MYNISGIQWKKLKKLNLQGLYFKFIKIVDKHDPINVYKLILGKSLKSIKTTANTNFLIQIIIK